MSNIYNYFVNPKIVSYISSEYIDSKKIDVSNPATLNNVQIAVKKVLDDTYNLLDKSKISKNNVNDAIDKFVNVSMKRLNLQPKQRNIAAPVNIRIISCQINLRFIITIFEGIFSITSSYININKIFNNNINIIFISLNEIF